MDADTGRIVASALTGREMGDGAQAAPLLDQVTGTLASFAGDGGYDQDRVYDAVAKRHPEADIVIPPRATAVPGDTAETEPTQRDRHLQCVEPRGSPDIAQHSRMGWQKASGYAKRSRAETAIGRWKQVIGDGLRSRKDERRATATSVAVHALNRMLELRRPTYVRTA